MEWDDRLRLKDPRTDAWAALVVDRIEALLTTMGWEPMTLALELYPGAIKNDSGPKGVINWFRRRTLPGYALWAISKLLGVSADYLALVHDDLETAIVSRGLFDYQRLKHERALAKPQRLSPEVKKARR